MASCVATPNRVGMGVVPPSLPGSQMFYIQQAFTDSKYGEGLAISARTHIQ